jgi:nicotinamide-nucleotide amidase
MTDQVSFFGADVETRAQTIVSMLQSRKLSIVTAESCTAGLIALALSRAEGATSCLQGGFIAYSKEQKTAALNVASEILRREDGVSEKVVQQMLAGALERSPADIAVAVSGVLGPEQDEDGNPVGLICFGSQRRSQPARVVRANFGPKDEPTLRRQAVLRAFDLIVEAAKA